MATKIEKELKAEIAELRLELAKLNGKVAGLEMAIAGVKRFVVPQSPSYPPTYPWPKTIPPNPYVNPHPGPYVNPIIYRDGGNICKSGNDGTVYSLQDQDQYDMYPPKSRG